LGVAAVTGQGQARELAERIKDYEGMIQGSASAGKPDEAYEYRRLRNGLLDELVELVEQAEVDTERKVDAELRGKLEVAEARVAELEEALHRAADNHHRTLVNSKLHDPERIALFIHCPCLSCRAAASALSAAQENETP
jgi:predicted protein tyrosine phosphatase